MPTYAVKIGEVMLRSDKPITEEQKRRALAELKELDPVSPLGDGLDVVISLAVLDSH